MIFEVVDEQAKDVAALAEDKSLREIMTIGAFWRGFRFLAIWAQVLM